MSRPRAALYFAALLGACHGGDKHGSDLSIDPIVGAWLDDDEARGRIFFHWHGDSPFPLDDNGRGWGVGWEREDPNGGLSIVQPNQQREPVTETAGDGGTVVLIWLNVSRQVELTRAPSYLVIDDPDAGGFVDASCGAIPSEE